MICHLLANDLLQDVQNLLKKCFDQFPLTKKDTEFCPQRHKNNKNLDKKDADYSLPFKEFYKLGEQPLGATDIMFGVMHGAPVVAIEDESQAFCEDELKDVEDMVDKFLEHKSEFQSEPQLLAVIRKLLKAVNIAYDKETNDLFARIHDGKTTHGRGGTAYIDGASLSIPSLYVEKSGVTPAEEYMGENPLNKDVHKLWWTKYHSEFGQLTFMNLMICGGPANASLDQMLTYTPEQQREIRLNFVGFKLWMFVLDDDKGNLLNADKYAREVHSAKSWRDMVNQMSGAPYLKVSE